MAKKKELDYFETFNFPDIPWQNYPVYSVSEGGKIFNFKSIIYPNQRSAKKFTRRKQLVHRSLQAKIFDALINVGYFDPLLVIKEFPLVIQNNLRLSGQEGAFILADYFFPTLDLIVELDSDLHSDKKDSLRDQYLDKLGISVFRIRNLEKEITQKTKFHDLTKFMRSKTPLDSPKIFDFQFNIKQKMTSLKK